MVYIVSVLDGLESLKLDLRWERGIAAYLDSERQWFWVCPWTYMRRNTGRQSAWRPTVNSFEFLEAVLRVSKLRAEVRFCRLH